MVKKPSQSRRRLLLERLEDRLLFDGAPDQPMTVEPDVMVQTADVGEVTSAEVAASDAPATGNEAGMRLLESLSQISGMLADDVAAETATDQASLEDAIIDQVAESVVVPADPMARREIVFISTDIYDYEYLSLNLPSSVQIALITGDRDGMEQIAEALQGETGIDAIHIISHGSAGQLWLGSSTVTAESLRTVHADELEIIRSALSNDGDILIYGCDFAAGEPGMEAVNLIAAAAQADLAASVDHTGSHASGGDWELEVQTGSVEAQTLSFAGWNGVLAPGPISLKDDGGTDDVTQDSSDVTGITVDYTNRTSGLLTVAVQIDPTSNSGSDTSNIAIVFDVDGDNNSNYGFAITLGGAPNFSVQQFSLFYGAADNQNNKISGSQTTIGTWNSSTGWATSGTYLNGPLQTTWALDTTAVDPFDGLFDSRVTLTLDLDDILGHWLSLGNTGTYSSIRLMNATTQPSHSASSAPKDIGISTAGPYLAVNDSATINEDSSVTLNVAANDSVGLSPSSIELGTSPTNGTVTIGSNGNLTYTPNANFNGTDTFTYLIYGLDGDARTATVTVVVGAVDDVPLAANDAFTTNEDQPVTGTVATNDSGLGDGGLTFSQLSSPVNGTLSWSSNGSFTYTPAANFSGTDTFTYRVTDADGDTSTATVTITVNAVNDAPTTTNDSVTTDEDTSIVLALGDFGTYSDPEGTTIAGVRITALPAAGLLQFFNGTSWAAVTVNQTVTAASITAGNFRFVPSTNQNGTPYTTVGFQVSDGSLFSTSRVLTINVTPVNDPPAVTDDSFTTNEDSPVVLSVLSNDSDIEGGTLAITQINGSAIVAGGSSIVVTNGTVSLNAAGTQLTFSPAANYSGAISFQYTVSDGTGGTATATVNGTVNPVNDPPVAVNDSNSTTENATTSGNVLTNDTDPDGDTLTVSAVNGVAGNVGSGVTGTNGGTFTINSNGGYTFNPGTAFDDLAAGQTRTTSVTYVASDNQGGTSSTTLTVTVTGTNDAPVSTPISNQTSTDSQTVSFSVAGNFSDPDTTNTLTFSASGLPAGLSINATTGLISGTIAANASVSGPYSVTVTATDNASATTSRTFTWTVTNPAPTATNDTGATTENANTSGNVLSNDTDPDGDTLTVSAVNGVAGNVGTGVTGTNGGTFTINS
ncbi:MAG: tandem-95 repeat protein, partial [Fuerstia sp.]|nr:tandem-95 repeat protein [Fuerstiella sp.]